MSIPQTYDFIDYLVAKKTIDDRSLNCIVWDRLQGALADHETQECLRVLEIGSGWGSFAIEAARQTGCRVTSRSCSSPVSAALNEERDEVDPAEPRHAAELSAIRQAILDLAARGAGVVVISQDLDELMEISDSFSALSEGRLSPPRPARGLTVEEIGLMMGGSHDMEVAHVAE